MDNITKADIEQAIKGFLHDLYTNKYEPVAKKLEAAIASNNEADIETYKSAIAKLQDKFSHDTWMEYASSWMSTQLSFGTHISKGIHASSKGDNVIFIPANHQLNNKSIAGHHCLSDPIIDASGNAAALPLAAFLQTLVSKESDVTLGELIKQKHPTMTTALHSNADMAKQIFETFYNLIVAHISSPTTDELNKQILWPTEDSYHCLIPLYPTSLTHHLYQTIQDRKFSEANTQAKKNRYKESAAQPQHSYITIKDLAVVNIGGSNPQGVSQLMSKKRGKTYLLPSMPPKFTPSQDLSFSKNAKSIFKSKSLAYRSRHTLDALYDIIKVQHNNVSIREARKSILDELLLQVLGTALSIQQNRPAGWSKDYQLDYDEKLWLDPHRRELSGEDKFLEDYENGYWQQAIETRFAHWLQNLLKNEDTLKAFKNDFADPEHNEWEREMQDAIKYSQRMGQGAFA